MEKNRELIRRLIIAVTSMEGAYDQICKKVGIKSNMLWLLYALDDGKFHSQKQICEEWLFPKTTINTLIKECEALGYITLQTIPGRKRELQICLTESGKAYAQAALKVVYQAEEEALRLTLETYAPDFISAFENFSKNIKTSFENTD